MKIIWLYLEHKVCVAGRIALDHVLKFTFCQLSTGWIYLWVLVLPPL